MSRLVVMGSGVTAPTMVRTHRSVLAATFADAPPGPGTALALDTTFGFQDNADDLAALTAVMEIPADDKTPREETAE